MSAMRFSPPPVYGAHEFRAHRQSCLRFALTDKALRLSPPLFALQVCSCLRFALTDKLCVCLLLQCGGSDTDTDTDRHIHRHRDTDTDTDTDTQTHRHRHRDKTLANPPTRRTA